MRPVHGVWQVTCSSMAPWGHGRRGYARALHRTSPADGTGNRYLDSEAVTAHLMSCTEAGSQPGSMSSVMRRPVQWSGPSSEWWTDSVGPLGPVRTPAGAPRDGVGRPGGETGFVGRHREHAAELRCALGRGRRNVCAPPGRRQSGACLNPFAQLASAGVPLAFGSDTPVTDMNPWTAVRAATLHRTAGSSISMRASFAAATRGAWRAGGVHDGLTGTLVPGAMASFSIWDVRTWTSAPRDAVARWSTDPRSRSGVAGTAPADSPACLPTDGSPGRGAA